MSLTINKLPEIAAIDEVLNGISILLVILLFKVNTNLDELTSVFPIFTIVSPGIVEAV